MIIWGFSWKSLKEDFTSFVLVYKNLRVRPVLEETIIGECLSDLGWGWGRCSPVRSRTRGKEWPDPAVSSPWCSGWAPSELWPPPRRGSPYHGLTALSPSVLKSQVKRQDVIRPSVYMSVFSRKVLQHISPPSVKLRSTFNQKLRLCKLLEELHNRFLHKKKSWLFSVQSKTKREVNKAIRRRPMWNFSGQVWAEIQIW